MIDYQIYVDGSWNSKTNYAGWGFVVLKNLKKVHERCGKTPFPAMSRQIDGELEATKQAIKWCLENNILAVSIFADYLGIKMWYEEKWNAKKKVAVDYVRFCKNIRDKIKVNIFHIQGHSGDYWNEYVDQLAERGKHEAI